LKKLSPPFEGLIFIHIFFVKFLLLEGDPSSLQTSASSGFSEFGMTDESWYVEGKEVAIR
jgi:hypothetical protein